jgi:hypothetical protein
LAPAAAALVRSVEREELLRALRAAIDLLLQESGEVREPASNLDAQLRELPDDFS